MLKVVFKEYLQNLRDSKAKNVPRLHEIAEEIGLSMTAFSQIINNERDAINMEIADKVKNFMEKRGFKMTITDYADFE